MTTQPTDPHPAPPWRVEHDPSFAGLALPRPVSRALAWAPALLWAPPLALYVATLGRGIGWVDGGMIARHVYEVNTSAWVNSHNLFYVVGRVWTLLLPMRDFATSLNLLCAVLAAITVHLVLRAGLHLTGDIAAVALGGIALATSHTLWWHATTLEVYTLNTALLGAAIACVLGWERRGSPGWLAGAVLCLGLGVSNHVLMALFLPALAGLGLSGEGRQRLRDPRLWGLCAGALALGMQLWLVVFVQSYAEALRQATGNAWLGETASVRASVLRDTWYDATGGRFRELMFPSLPAAEVWRWRANWALMLAVNYPSLALPLAPVGAWAWWRSGRYRATLGFVGVGAALQAVWSMNYAVWDMFAFGLPVWVLVGLFATVGAHAALQAARTHRVARWVLIAALPTLLVGPWLHQAVPRWARDEGGFWHRYFAAFGPMQPLWEPADWFAAPAHGGYDRAMRVVHGYLALPSGAHVWDDDGRGQYPVALYHQRVLGERLDIVFHPLWLPKITPEYARRQAEAMRDLALAGEPVFAASIHRPERAVLNQLYLLLREEEASGGGGDDVTLEALKAMPDDTFEATFPRGALARYPLWAGEDAAWIYAVTLEPVAPDR